MIRKISLVFTLLTIFLGVNSPNFAYAKTIQANDLLNLIVDAKGKQVVLVNFYASWCPPCVEEVPHLVNLRKKYSEEELKIIGINLDESVDTMTKFNTRMGINYTTFSDTGSIQNLYRIDSIPFTIIYGKSGNTIYAQAGYASENALTKVIEYGMK